MKDDDRDHISVNIYRVYKLLTAQWIDYMKYIKNDYPYLYKYSVKMNPFNSECKLVTEIVENIK